ncbi:MAG: hypothetical protein GY821_08015, partial [Gammaproteobacteria bacterium]|nr:hypothetical protein [Gammaproteobacteria bacterium]
MSYNVWYLLFSRYIYLLDMGRRDSDKLTDAAKNSLFFTLLGNEGARRFACHPIASRIDTASHSDFVAGAKSLFAAPVNSIRAHFEFHQRVQGRGETATECTSLRS